MVFDYVCRSFWIFLVSVGHLFQAWLGDVLGLFQPWVLPQSLGQGHLELSLRQSVNQGPADSSKNKDRNSNVFADFSLTFHE